MDGTLMAVYIGILCAAMLVLLAWLIIQLVLEFRRKNKFDGKDIVELDGKYYRVVPLTGDAGEEVAVSSAGQESAPAAERPEADTREAESPAQAAEVQEGAELVAVDEDTVILRRSENLSYEEAYPTLSQEQKRFADDIIAYAVSKEDGLKDQVGGRYASVYIGKKTARKAVYPQGDRECASARAQ